MAIAQLSIDMVAKIAEFEKDLKRATTATERQTSIMANALKGLGGAFTVGFVVDFAKRTIDSVDALNDLADATGASVENLSALEDIAARTGANMDTVTTAMVKFNGMLKDVKPGSDSEKAFKALNLDVAELKRLDPAEALLKTATAFAGFADDGNKARIMQELFGKSLKDVAPFLKDLADKGELVAKVTTQQAQEAEKFNKQIFEMQKNFHDLSREIEGPLVSAFNAYIEKQNEAKKAGKFGLFTSPIQAELAYNASRATGSWGDAVGNAGRGNVNPELVKPALGDLPVNGKTAKPKAEQISEDSRALAAYVDGLQRVLEKNDTLTEQEKALNFLRTIGATGEIAQVRELTLGMAAQIDQEKALTDVRTAKIAQILAEGDAVSHANEEYQALLARLYAATPQFNVEAQRKDVLALTAEFEAGRISESLYLEAVTARLDLVAEKTDKTKTAAEELGLTFASAFEDAIVSGKDLSTVLDGLIDDMLRITVRRAITEPMANMFSGFLGSILPSFAVGTDYVPQDMVAQIHKGERIVPAAQNKGNNGGGQPITVIQNFTVGDVASVSMVRQAVAGSERRIAAGIGRSMTYGGALA